VGVWGLSFNHEEKLGPKLLNIGNLKEIRKCEGIGQNPDGARKGQFLVLGQTKTGTHKWQKSLSGGQDRGSKTRKSRLWCVFGHLVWV
jgi:hypothetical protein